MAKAADGKTTTLRLSKEHVSMLEKLAKKFVTSESAIMKRALVEMARKEGL